MNGSTGESDGSGDALVRNTAERNGCHCNGAAVLSAVDGNCKVNKQTNKQTNRLHRSS
jgi:hypothetical protein